VEPYRGAPRPLALVPARPLPRRNPWWLWGAAAAIAAAGAVVLTPVVAAGSFAGFIAVNAGILHVALNASARRKADRILASLPFSLVHSSGSAWFLPPGQRIAKVEVRFASALDGPDLAREAGNASARVPWLAVRTAGDTIEITRWPARGDDVLVLAELLELWGEDVHRRHPIAQVVVTWTTEGPPPSM
jgi:hypothetical protein